MDFHNLLLLTLALANVALAKPDTSLIMKLGEKRLVKILETHALLGSLAWVVIIPLGAIAFALLKTPRLFRIHSTIQTIGLLCLIPNFVLGVILGIAYGKLYNNIHTVMGTVVFAIALFQPVWGILQHRVYTKTGKTTWWGLIHRWVGRITITAAVINGGLGFILLKGHRSYSRGGLIAYIVVSSVIWSIFVAAVVFETIKSARMRAITKDSRNSSRDSTIEVVEQKNAKTGIKSW